MEEIDRRFGERLEEDECFLHSCAVEIDCFWIEADVGGDASSEGVFRVDGREGVGDEDV